MEDYKEKLRLAKEALDSGSYDKETIEYIFPELKESEDERIRKTFYEYFKERKDDGDVDETWYGISYDKILAWLEKQGEHANFRNKIQIGDEVTRNEDGALVNLSQCKRMVKQGEQKSLNKVEQEDVELTDFESALFSAFSDAWQEYLSGKEVNIAKWAKEHSAELLEVAREQKPAWNEEDEDTFNDIIMCLDGNFKSDKSMINWLKSLKERYTWKPSEGQLECLGYAIEKAEKDWSPLTNNRIYLTLKALKEQLEKL